MLTNLLQTLAPLLATDPVVVGIVGILVLWAVGSGVALERATSRVRTAFAGARRTLGAEADPVAFASRYEQVSADLARNKLLSEGWNGFRESLIVPSQPGRPIVATASPRDWFDLSGLLRATGADPRYHASLPGLLVGAGLLFTFLGLAAALSLAGSVVAEGVSQEQRNGALRALLGAASVKFVISLAGLLFSILYTVWRKRCLKRAEKAMAAFFLALHARLPYRTPAALLADGNAILEKQYADIQRIGSDFFVNLGSTLEREFGSGLEQHLGPLAAALDKLSGRLANQNEDAMQSMLRAFLERLEGAVGGSMHDTAATLNVLGTRLDGLQGAMDSAAQRMGRAAEEMAAGMGRGAQSALSGVTEQMAALVTTLRSAAEEAGRANRAAGDELARRMADTTQTLMDAVAAFRQRMEEGAASGMDRLATSVDALLGQMRELGDRQRQAGADATAALADSLGRSASALETTAGKVADILGGGAAQASNRLVAATEAMRDDLRGVLDQFGSVVRTSGKVLNEEAAAGGDRLRVAAAALGEGIEASAARLRDAGEAAGTALRGGGQAAGASMEDAGRTLAGNSDGLGQRLVEIGNASHKLAGDAETVGVALRTGAAPVAEAANNLRTAAELTSGSVIPLREAAEAIRASAGGLGSAVTAFEIGQRSATDLTTRLGAAIDRFGGLDTAMAQTLRSLQEGLSGYQREIATFVRNMDEGFAKNAHALQAMAQELANSVEELAEARAPQRARA